MILSLALRFTRQRESPGGGGGLDSLPLHHPSMLGVLSHIPYPPPSLISSSSLNHNLQNWSRRRGGGLGVKKTCEWILFRWGDLLVVAASLLAVPLSLFHFLNCVCVWVKDWAFILGIHEGSLIVCVRYKIIPLSLLRPPWCLWLRHDDQALWFLWWWWWLPSLSLLPWIYFILLENDCR